jgi:hypothetical protein
VPEYLVLLAPSSNRVYAGDAPVITAAEVEIVVPEDQLARAQQALLEVAAELDLKNVERHEIIKAIEVYA